jgi:hypothetical protein
MDPTGPAGDHPDRAAAWEVFRTLQGLRPGPSNSLTRAQWFEHAFAMDDGSFAVLYGGVGRARGSIMLTARQRLFDDAPDAARVVAGLTGGWHTSRVDLTADVSAGVAATPSMLFAMLSTARSRSRLEHRVLTVNGAGGETLTLGSRASARYLRVYVKGDRIRHELELKQDAAGAAWDLIRAGFDPAGVFVAEYGRVVQWR